MAAESPLKDRIERDGALLRLTLARPKANLVDAAMIAALHGALVAWRGTPTLRAVLLDAEGPHFSFGASVEEHLPGRCAAMLASLHALILAMLEFPAPILVVVRGQCLGGGLEVALAGSAIFDAPDAQFGQPEMNLGVFAPAASVLLPWRVNQPAAEWLLFSGRSVGAAQAKAMGLAQVVFDDPETAALACAVAAVRGAMIRDVRQRLAEVERLYLDRLMATRDANEGLVAFLAKRKPNWEHR
jgi:cyclohexa-1,5-dienecarbonyl-CoA hydratase